MTRRKTSAAEDLMDLVARLPWWAGVLLAALAYLLLGQVAQQPVPSTVRPDQMASALTQTLWRSLATMGQYLLPVICLAGAGISA